MKNSQKLLQIIKDKGYSVADVAKALKIDKSTFYRKINENKTCEFSIKEADEIKSFLNLSQSEASAIFFTNPVA